MKSLNALLKGLSLTALTLTLLSACGESHAPTRRQLLAAGAGIVNGEDVVKASKESRSLALLVDQSSGSICTATLIDKNLLLTAAHCIGSDSSLMQVIFSVDTIDGDEMEVRSVVRALAHERYRRRGFPRNDIGLVLFEGAAPSGSEIARLGTLEDFGVERKIDFLAIGYGRVNGRIEDTSDTGDTGRLRKKILSGFWEKTTEQTLVVEQKQGGACFGDSGGPALLVGQEDQPNRVLAVATGVYQIGADEDAEDFDICRQLAEYTAVPFFAQWIAEKSVSIRQAQTLKTAPASARVR